MELLVGERVDIFATPNCPTCLTRMELLGPEGGEEWTCPDPECGVVVLF